MCHKVRYNNLYLQIFNPYFYSDFTDFFIAEHNYVKLRNAFTTTLIHGRVRFFCSIWMLAGTRRGHYTRCLSGASA